MFTINTWLIVIPSIQKYLQRAIMVEVSTETLETLHAPAITFCRRINNGYVEVYQNSSTKIINLLKFYP